MATYQDDYQNPEEEVPLAAGGAQVGSSGAATGGTTNEAPATTGFVNFDRYFNTNHGAANQMANTVAGGVESRGQEAQSAMQTAQDDFAKNVAASAPTAENPNYTGPAYFGDKQDLSGTYDAMHKAETGYEALGSFGGRQALLGEHTNTLNNYTQGMGRFDTALMSRAGADRFQDLNQGFEGFDSWFKSATEAGQGLVDQQRDEARRLQAEERKQDRDDQAPKRGDLPRPDLRRNPPARRRPVNPEDDIEDIQFFEGYGR